MKTNSYKLEPLESKHGPAVIEIFNHYIEHSFAAYPEQKFPLGFFGSLLEKTAGYPSYAMIAAEDEQVVGFCFLKPYNPFPSFKSTAEITYFIAPNYVRKGLGKYALSTLESDAKKMGINHLLASISSLNTPSLSFHLQNGFSQCGNFTNIGTKFETSFSVVWMQKELNL